ncbi:MAG TPA: hypothetical protein VHV74_21445 [Pseudonocardiaceae bacterium]|nr:hypothetical protein [Pseudonocardiaceae bacterium]
MDHDEDPLLAELAAALRSRQAVPDRFVELGRSAFAFRDTAAEIAALAEDSTALAGARAAERADLRSLTFVSGATAIEVEVTPTGLVGQVVPPRAGRIEVLTPAGPFAEVAVDEVGWFSVQPPPSGPTRLHLSTEDGTTISTEWTTL